MLTNLFWLLSGHALCDYALQPDLMVRYKKRTAKLKKGMGRWWWWLLAHSMTCGIPVALVMGAPWLGFVYALAHAGTDFLKNAGVLTDTTDQLLHIIVLVAIAGWLL